MGDNNFIGFDINKCEQSLECKLPAHTTIGRTKDAVDQITLIRNNTFRKRRQKKIDLSWMKNERQRRYDGFFEWKTPEQIEKDIIKILNKNKLKNILDLYICANNDIDLDLKPFDSFRGFINSIIIWSGTRKTASSVVIKMVCEKIWLADYLKMANRLMTKRSFEWITTKEDFKQKVFYTKTLGKEKKSYEVTWLDIIKSHYKKSNTISIDLNFLYNYFIEIWKPNLIKNFVDKAWLKLLNNQREIDSLEEKELYDFARKILQKNGYNNIFDIINSKIAKEFKWDFYPFGSFSFQREKITKNNT